MKQHLEALGKIELCDFTYNGQDALDCARNHIRSGKAISHIFMDYMMPRLNGIQAAKRIQDFIKEWNEQNECSYEEPVFVFVTAFTTQAF